MNSSHNAQYRLDLATMYLRRAKSRWDEGEWDSCVREAQVSIENAAKSILACFRPVPYTHDLAKHLRALVRDIPNLDEETISNTQQIIALAEAHNSDEHAAATYGDEDTRTPPWELFDENKARSSLADAEEACEIARSVFHHRFPKYKYAK